MYNIINLIIFVKNYEYNNFYIDDLVVFKSD